MLLEYQRKKTREYFAWEKLIPDEVDLTRAELRARRHCRTRVGYDDPTGDFVARKNSRLKRVWIKVNGLRIKIDRPEDWLDVVRATYDLYSRQPIAWLVQERIKTGKSVEVLSGFMGISKETYHKWEREFMDDASFLAAKAGLMDEKNS